MTGRRKLFVTGAAGMVGSYVRRVFGDHDLVLTDVRDAMGLDVRDGGAVKRAIADARPDVVLHLAAATDVDRCQQEPALAERTNAVGTRNVVDACETSGIPLVYVSTGAVFRGERAEPYSELDTPAPVNVYARTKYAGEQAVAALERYYIVRAGWMFGGAGRDVKFVGKMARLIQQGQRRLEAVDDVVGSPTYALDLLGGIRQLLATGAWGAYNMPNAGWCTRHACAVAIRDVLGRPDVEVAAVSSDRFPLPAPRGSEALRSVKLAPLGIVMRPWQDALREYLLGELAIPAHP